MKISLARLVVQYLRDMGVRHIFGLSGHSVFALTDALYDEPAIKFVPVQHELSAAYMAVAYAKGTRKLGVCLASSGAGATNLLTGIAQAYKESAPVIALAADVSCDVAGMGASSWHEIPQEEIFRPVTKMSVTLTRETDIAGILSEAVRAATTGRKGPVYLGLPRDLQSEEVEVSGLLWKDEPPSNYPFDLSVLQKAYEELTHAASPTIIAGGGVFWSKAEQELKELAELLSAPFGTTPSHKGLISEDHPLALGILGSGAFPFANSACLESDLILAVGVTFSEGLTLGYKNRVIPDGVRIIQVDIDPREIGKSHSVYLPIIGDAKMVLRELIGRAKSAGGSKATPSPRVERIAREKILWREKIAGHEYDLNEPINQWHLYRALKEAVDEQAVVVGAGGTGELMKRFIAPSYVYHSGDFRAIGNGLSTAIGLKFAFPSRPVVCVTGDGSFMLELQELATVTASGLAIVIIVVRNSAYGNMKRDQIKHYNGRVIGTELNLPDLCALAGAFGIHGERVERPQQLVPAIKGALSVGKPVLLDVVCPIEGI